MKRIFKNKINIYALALLCTLSAMISCDEDWWVDHGYQEVTGEWRIVEASYASPYRANDYWTFYPNGDFSTDGYKLQENGWWNRRGRTIQINFRGYNGMDAYVSSYSNVDYMVLDVTDYDRGGQTYRIRLIRTGY